MGRLLWLLCPRGGGVGRHGPAEGSHRYCEALSRQAVYRRHHLSLSILLHLAAAGPTASWPCTQCSPARVSASSIAVRQAAPVKQFCHRVSASRAPICQGGIWHIALQSTGHGVLMLCTAQELGACFGALQACSRDARPFLQQGMQEAAMHLVLGHLMLSKLEHPWKCSTLRQCCAQGTLLHWNELKHDQCCSLSYRECCKIADGCVHD